MQFLNPMAAWALLGLLCVVALYMLRRRHEPREVPSTHLWMLALRSQQVERPLQRLKKNLLMLLQLLLVLLLALSLMRPAIWSASGAQELALVVDVSASMGADVDGISRIEHARREAARMVDALPDGSRVSIVAAGSEVRQILSRATGKQQILRAIDSLQAEHGGAQTAEALSLLRAVRQEIPHMQIAVLTDDAHISAGDGVRVIPIGSAAANRAVVSLKATMGEGGGRALAQIANYGPAATVTVECYQDGTLRDARLMELGEGETVPLGFDLAAGAAVVSARITDSDALNLDNERHAVVPGEGGAVIALCGASNVFLEKVLPLSGARLIKTSVEEAASIPGVDLYVYDSQLPAQLPERGALLLVNPGGDVPGFSVGEPIDGGRLALVRGDMTDGLTLSDVRVRTVRPIVGPGAVLTCGGQVVMAASDVDGRMVAVLGFDLHDSNLPMKYDYPVLMHNLLQALLPDVLSGAPDGDAGQRMELALSARAESAEVIMPSGSAMQLAPPFPALPLSRTDEVGVYALRQALDDGTVRESRFALGVPGAESDLRSVPIAIGQGEGGAAAGYGLDLTKYVLLALLALSVVEWWVSRRED